MIKFSFLTGDINWKEYGGKFISSRQSNSEFDYWFVMDVSGTDYTGEQHEVTLTVVAPAMVGADVRKDALGGMADEDVTWDNASWVEILHSYGVFAHVWRGTGPNLRKLMKEARQAARECEMLFGFYMDRQMNSLGATGWDFLAGNPTGIWA